VPRFRAELKLEGKTGTYVVVPLDVPAVFGRARPPVRGTINGSPLRSTIAKYGDDYFLVINRKVREAAGVAVGETVDIELELDTKPRIVPDSSVLRWVLSTAASPGRLLPLSDGPRGRERGFLRLRVLWNARKLVAQGWTQGADARDRDGRPVHPWSPNARSWSMLGAIVCGDETHQGRVALGSLAEAVVIVASAVDASSLNDWNDESVRTQADVLAAFDATIASNSEGGEGRVHDARA
jgi:Domain of unknown function (DUF1905)